METFNLTAPTDTILEDLFRFTKGLEKDSFQVTWMRQYDIPIALIVTKFGLCFNFNLMPSKKLLNHSEYFFLLVFLHFSKLFACRISLNFQYNYIMRTVFINQQSNEISTRIENDKFPINPASDKQMLNIGIENIDIDTDITSLGGCQMIMHNVDEYPFEDKNLFTLTDGTMQILEITPVVTEAHESLASTTVFE